MSARRRERADEQPISAQVVLKPAGDGLTEPITAANIHSILPSASVVAAVSEWFRGRGFDVGPAVGLSFSVTARPAVFESTFGRRLPRSRDGRVDVTGAGQGYELPLTRLGPIAGHVAAVVFPPPPDFGPVSGGVR